MKPVNLFASIPAPPYCVLNNNYVTRPQIVKAARHFEGCQFDWHNMNCGTFLLRVCDHLGILNQPIDNIVSMFGRIEWQRKLEDVMNASCIRLCPVSSRAGTILCLRPLQSRSSRLWHIAIITQPDEIIHASNMHSKIVIRERLDYNMVCAAYDFPRISGA